MTFKTLISRSVLFSNHINKIHGRTFRTKSNLKQGHLLDVIVSIGSGLYLFDFVSQVIRRVAYRKLVVSKNPMISLRTLFDRMS